MLLDNLICLLIALIISIIMGSIPSEFGGTQGSNRYCRNREKTGRLLRHTSQLLTSGEDTTSCLRAMAPDLL